MALRRLALTALRRLALTAGAFAMLAEPFCLRLKHAANSPPNCRTHDCKL